MFDVLSSPWSGAEGSKVRWGGRVGWREGGSKDQGFLRKNLAVYHSQMAELSSRGPTPPRSAKMQGGSGFSEGGLELLQSLPT